MFVLLPIVNPPIFTEKEVSTVSLGLDPSKALIT